MVSEDENISDKISSAVLDIFEEERFVYLPNIIENEVKGSYQMRYCQQKEGKCQVMGIPPVIPLLCQESSLIDPLYII